MDCLHRGIPVLSVDGVKRRTRASMGYCQGAFCRPRIQAIMEREYGVPIDTSTDIQKEGAARVTREEFLAYERQQKKDC